MWAQAQLRRQEWKRYSRSYTRQAAQLEAKILQLSSETGLQQHPDRSQGVSD